MKKITRTLPSKKRIALVAHDGMKHDLLMWVQRNLSALQNHQLVATSTTAQYLSINTPLLLDRLSSGPMGGDQQIGARITEGEIDVLVFFWDPLDSHPHQFDVIALLRLATVWNIPVATNPSSADLLFGNHQLGEVMPITIPDTPTCVYQQR